MTRIEEEVIFLKAIHDLIDSMVNAAMLEVLGEGDDCEVAFPTSIHARHFNTLLVDLLSKTGSRAPVPVESYLDALNQILEAPSFSFEDSIAELRSAVVALTEWLQKEFTADVWLPSINVQANLTMSRSKFLRMCGNISKHDLLRLDGIARDLQGLLAASGVNIDLSSAMLALDDFYQRFHSDVFAYHSSMIAELLNNVRLGVVEYLRTEFRRSIVYENDSDPAGAYHYRFPDGVNDIFARHAYWDLMNLIRRGPYMRRFTVTKWLKLRY